MDLIRVNANVNNPTNTFEPYGPVIQNYTSLVWTEKFQDHSEFVLTTQHIDQFLIQLPLESYVTLLQSKEVMKVESHLLERKSDGTETLTIRGRSITSILTNRVIQLASPSKTAKLRLNNAAEVLAFLVIYSTVEPYTDTGEFAGAFDPNGISGGFVVTSNVPIPSSGTPYTYWIPAGVVDSTIRPYMQESGLGISFRRPDGQSGYVLGASPISSTDTASIDVGRFDLRLPSDLSDDSNPGSVIFVADKGHFINISWLNSVKDAKTVGYLNVPNTTNMTASAFNPSFPDANLRTKLGLLGYSHESSLPGDDTEGTPTEIEDGLTGQMIEQMALNHPLKVVTSGEVSNSAPYRYSEHYELGDIVGVYSVRYGLQKLRVTEFIRSWESGIEKAYPTLSQIT